MEAKNSNVEYRGSKDIKYHLLPCVLQKVEYKYLSEGNYIFHNLTNFIIFNLEPHMGIIKFFQNQIIQYPLKFYNYQLFFFPNEKREKSSMKLLVPLLQFCISFNAELSHKGGLELPWIMWKMWKLVSSPTLSLFFHIGSFIIH